MQQLVLTSLVMFWLGGITATCLGVIAFGHVRDLRPIAWELFITTVFWPFGLVKALAIFGTPEGKQLADEVMSPEAPEEPMPPQCAELQEMGFDFDSSIEEHRGNCDKCAALDAWERRRKST